jgi:hypothetical protein
MDFPGSWGTAGENRTSQHDHNIKSMKSTKSFFCKNASESHKRATKTCKKLDVGRTKNTGKQQILISACTNHIQADTRKHFAHRSLAWLRWISWKQAAFMNEGMHEKNHAQITRLIQQRSVASLHHHRILHVLISGLAAAQSNAFCSEQLPSLFKPVGVRTLRAPGYRGLKWDGGPQTGRVRG